MSHPEAARLCQLRVCHPEVAKLCRLQRLVFLCQLQRLVFLCLLQCRVGPFPVSVCYLEAASLYPLLRMVLRLQALV